MKSFNVLCPFHKEKVPSCRIWVGGDFFCHGCHMKGNVEDYPVLKQIYSQQCTKYLEEKGQLTLF